MVPLTSPIPIPRMAGSRKLHTKQGKPEPATGNIEIRVIDTNRRDSLGGTIALKGLPLA